MKAPPYHNSANLSGQCQGVEDHGQRPAYSYDQGEPGGFGDVGKAARVFVANELEPLQQTMLEINDRVGEEVVRFHPYSLEAPQPVETLDPSR